MRALEELRTWGMEDCLQLLHFHLGSQITNIRQIKGAVTEAGRIYAEIWREGATGLKFMDVGGGLGIDYDGSQTDFESSVNYTLQEYANDVVYHIQNVCDESNVPHPTIITESGRAIAAYHSVLVFNVLGVSGLGEEEVPPELPGDPEQPLIDLQETLPSVNSRICWKAFHDAQQALDSALNLFSLGYLPLDQRSMRGKYVSGRFAARSRKWRGSWSTFPEELEGLDAMLSDTYFCNFSLFQSMPDSWAIKQLFPIMPIHRLKKSRPITPCWATSPAIPTAKWISSSTAATSKRTLPLHAYNGERLLSRSVSGGRLPGDPRRSAQSVRRHQRRARAPGREGEVVLDAVIKGDTVREVLDYVQFKVDSAGRRSSGATWRAAVREGRIGYEEAGRLLRFYEDGLNGYTYLEQ